MTHDAVMKQGLSIRSRVAPYLVLALMLAGTVWLWRFGEEHRARGSSHMPLDPSGHTGSWVVRSTPQFEAAQAPYLSWILLAVGLAGSVLVFLLMRSQQRSVAKSTALAAKLTTDLRKSEQRLTRLNTVSPAVIYTVAPVDGSTTWVSSNVTALTGYAPEEALQPGWWAGHLHPEDRNQALARDAAALGAGCTVQEYRFQRKDGAFVWILDELRLLRDDQEQPVEIVGSWLDITARKRAAEEASRMVTVVRDSNDAITIQNTEGRITAWNRGAVLMYGYNEAEALQMSIERLTASGKVEEQKDFTRRLLAGEAITSLETQRVTKDGRVLDVWMTVTKLVDDAGESIGIASTERDITARKRAEEVLRKLNAELEQRVGERTRELVLAKEAAEQANRTKSVFLANMSHEIRTPLNAVLGFAQILVRDAALTPRQTEMLHTIARSGRHLLNLINDILDMSKIEAGRLKLSPVDFCLYDLLDDVEMMFRSHAHAKQLQLLMERDDSVPRYVNADEGKLRQVLINLMGNAVKFTGSSGEVRIRLDRVPEGVRVSVCDTGPGIAPEYREHIFDKFGQVSTRSEGKQNSSGLGLTFCKLAVEAQGGWIGVDSEVGKGSTFWFALPAAGGRPP